MAKVTKNTANPPVGLKREFKADITSNRKKFDKGPAIETKAVSLVLFSKLYSFIGTGLLHPNLKRIMQSAPRGSICLRGLRVNLPFT